MGEVVNFPKSKRPLPAGHEDVEQPGLRALARETLVRLGKAAPSDEPQHGGRRRPPVFKPKWMHWKPDTGAEDGGDGPDAA